MNNSIRKLRKEVLLMKDCKLINKRDVAEIMGLSVPTITNKMYQGKEGIDIPVAVKIGRIYKWRLATVLKFIDEKEHERKVLLATTSLVDKPVVKVQINRV